MSGFYTLDDKLIEDSLGEGMKIIAIGDMNNDKHIDLVTVNSDLDHFTVYFFDKESMSYNKSSPRWVDKENN